MSKIPPPTCVEDLANHVGLVRAVIGHYRMKERGVRLGFSFDDLVQTGVLGLIRAIDAWDPERGSWTTCAWLWIRQAIERDLQNTGCSVRVPVHVQTAHRAAKLPATPYVASLNTTIRGDGGDDSELERIDLLTYADEPDADDALDAVLNPPAARLAELYARAGLSERERTVLRLRSEDLTLEQIGNRLGGLSRERARQLERDALEKLRIAAGVSLDAPRVPITQNTHRQLRT